MTTTLGPGWPVTSAGPIADKAVAASASLATLVAEFDIWREGYAGATVEILRAGTTERADVYSDFNLSSPAPNPQTLLTQEDAAGRRYGKFAISLYVAEAYELKIDALEQTGIQRAPLSNMRDVRVDEATSIAFGGTRVRALRERFADVIRAVDYGALRPTSDIDASASENTTTIQAAIGAASANGGGEVVLPPGVFRVTAVTVPTRVRVMGAGKDATVLQSDESEKIVTITGDAAALEDLTLDGVNLTARSVGLFGKAVDDLRLTNVRIKRFDRGAEFKGGAFHRYRNLDIDDSNFGFRGLGDADAGNGDDGAAFQHMIWDGGSVRVSTATGVELSVVDLPVAFNQIRSVDFDDHAGSHALLIYGAENTEINDCRFDTSTIADMEIADNPDATLASRQVRAVYVEACRFTGALLFDGLCENVVFDRCDFVEASFAFNVPVNQINFRDCAEVLTTSSGDATKKGLWITTDHNRVVGTVTSATPVVVWKRQLQPGQVVLVNARAAFQRTNGEEWHVMQRVHAARCDSADIDYDGQTANFTVGETLTGLTSGATGRIVADSDAGTTGTLSLINLSGEFIDNELIEDSATGAARVNGSMTFNAASLVGTFSTLHNQASGSTGYEVSFAVSNREMQVTVIGASSETTAATVDVDATVVGS